MKRVWEYLEAHWWAQWAAAALFWGALLWILELAGRVLGR